MATETTSTSFADSVQLYLPDSSPAAFEAFDYATFRNAPWAMVGSTLPFWKNKKHISFTYTPQPGQSEGTWDDLCEYRAASDSAGTKKSSIKGVDLLKPGFKAGWKWRGKGLMSPITSHWQLLGYSFGGEVEWQVAYFAPTLFTPAGIDVMVRKGGRDLTEEEMKIVVGKIEKLGGEVGAIVEGGKLFRIELEQ